MSLVRVGRSPPRLKENVCFLCFPAAFTAVPQDLFHTPVAILSLTEPDKQLSHIRLLGLSLVCLRPMTGVQVFVGSRFWPFYADYCLVKVGPGVSPELALAVEPFEQDLCCTMDMDIVAAPLRVVRYGVVVQMPDYSSSGCPQHFSLCALRSVPLPPSP